MTILFALGASMSTASAQAPESSNTEQTPTTVSKEQLSLYVNAQEHYSQGRYEESIELLERANAMGSFDLFEYSLGQAYAKQERCLEAREHLLAAQSAPRSGPDLSARITQVLEELERTCPGTLRVECADATTKIFLDDGPALVCPIEKLTLSPGIHEVRAVLGSREERYRVGIIAMEEHSLRVLLTPPRDTAPEPTRRLSPPPMDRVLLVGGGALLTTALILDLTHTRGALETYRQHRYAGDFEAAAQARSRLRGSQAIVFGLAGAGLTSAAASIFLRRRASQRDDASSTSLLLGGSVTPRGSSLVLGVHF